MLLLIADAGVLSKRHQTMFITKNHIENYHCLRDTTVSLNSHLNIIVGDNECGKSTYLEAIHLALSVQLNGRPIQTEIHPHLFSSEAISDYIRALNANSATAPPTILIELYLSQDPALAKLRGKNNSAKEDTPGLKLIVEFNEDYRAEYQSYVADPSVVQTVPIEYYNVRWRDFADNDVTSRAVPIKPSLISHAPAT